MSPPTADPSGESPTDRPVLRRRPLLKALSAGAALSLSSGLAAGEEDHPHVSGPHEYYGLATPDAESVPLDVDHEVMLRTSQPEDPESPSRPPLFHFEPAGLQVGPDDIVQFTAVSPDHTVTAYHPGFGFQQRVPDRVPPFSSPVLNAGGAWFYRFEEPGVYDMYCGPHHILGMVLRVVSGEVEDEPEYVDTFEGRPPSDGQTPLLAPFSREFLEDELNALSEENEDCVWPWLTPTEVLRAPSLDPQSIQDSGEVSFGGVFADIDRFDGH